jgi:hypothetical protein
VRCFDSAAQLRPQTRAWTHRTGDRAAGGRGRRPPCAGVTGGQCAARGAPSWFLRVPGRQLATPGAVRARGGVLHISSGLSSRSARREGMGHPAAALAEAEQMSVPRAAGGCRVGAGQPLGARRHCRGDDRAACAESRRVCRRPGPSEARPPPATQPPGVALWRSGPLPPPEPPPVPRLNPSLPSDLLAPAPSLSHADTAPSRVCLSRRPPRPQDAASLLLLLLWQARASPCSPLPRPTSRAASPRARWCAAVHSFAPTHTASPPTHSPQLIPHRHPCPLPPP